MIVLDSIDQLADVFVEIERDLQALTYEQQLQDFLPILEQTHQDHFDSRSSPDGKAWQEWQWRAPWSPSEHETLEVSGRLRNSLKRGGQEHVEDLDIQGSGFAMLTWGTDVPYAGIHNFGASFSLGIPLIHRSGVGYLPPGTRINIPQREFLGMSEKTIQQLIDDVADATVEGMKG